jgi:hypothetical protein
VTLMASASAMATTFAEFKAVNSSDNFTWSNTGATAGSVSSGAMVDFSYLTSTMSSPTDLLANFNLTGSTTQAAGQGNGFVTQSGIDGGTFSFTYAGSTPFTYGGKTYTSGANLLSGTYTNAAIAGANGSQSGTFLDDSNAQGKVTFTSGLLKFDNSGDAGFSLSLTSIFPPLSAAEGGSLNSFDAVSTGSFYANLASGGGTGGVPEPASWALMLIGFGAIGAVTRRRRNAAFAAA